MLERITCDAKALNAQVGDRCPSKLHQLFNKQEKGARFLCVFSKFDIVFQRAWTSHKVCRITYVSKQLPSKRDFDEIPPVRRSGKQEKNQCRRTRGNPGKPPYSDIPRKSTPTCTSRHTLDILASTIFKLLTSKDVVFKVS